MKIGMRTKIFVLAILIICLLITGCGAKMSTVNDATVNDGDRSMFVQVEQGDTYRIVYHRGTKVMYVISDAIYNCGTFTVMLDANGKPLLYQEDADE